MSSSFSCRILVMSMFAEKSMVDNWRKKKTPQKTVTICKPSHNETRTLRPVWVSWDFVCESFLLLWFNMNKKTKQKKHLTSKSVERKNTWALQKYFYILFWSVGCWEISHDALSITSFFLIPCDFIWHYRMLLNFVFSFPQFEFSVLSKLSSFSSLSPHPQTAHSKQPLP